MAFPLKLWKNEPTKTTPISAEALQDIEERLGLWADRVVLSCRLTTVAALAAYTRTVNVLEANAVGAMATIDAVAPAVGDYILFRNGVSEKDNGVYKVLTLGGAAEKWKMERVREMDTSEDLKASQLVTVDQGTRGKDRIFMLTTNAPFTLNTTLLKFTPVPKDWGILEATPTTEALLGDRCSIKAAAGFGWDFIYTEEVAEYPWTCTGGTPLRGSTANGEATVSAAYVELGAVPTVTAPIKAKYVITHSSLLWNSGGGEAYANVFAAGVEAEALAYCRVNNTSPTTVTNRTGAIAIAAAGVVRQRYKVGSSGETHCQNRWVEILPTVAA